MTSELLSLLPDRGRRKIGSISDSQVSPKRHASNIHLPFSFRALALVVLASLATVAHAEMTELALQNGAVVKAEVLQRTDTRVVLDLGFDLLRIPSEFIAQEQDLSLLETSLPDETADVLDLEKRPRRKIAGGENFDAMVDHLKEAVVVVSNAGGFGAGFLIDPSGLVLTNHHVVRGEKLNDVTMFLRDKTGKLEKKIFRRVEVQAYSTLMDCAILKIPADQMKDMELPWLDLADPQTVQTGHLVYAIGNPGVGSKMLEHSLSQGIISSTNRNFNDVLYLQTTAAVNPGNSGGPLLNARGEVVGLITFRAIFQEGLAFALPVWYLRHFVENAKAYAPTMDGQNTGYRYHDPSESSGNGEQ